jgi:hypothetical protein
MNCCHAARTAPRNHASPQRGAYEQYSVLRIRHYTAAKFDKLAWDMKGIDNSSPNIATSHKNGHSTKHAHGIYVGNSRT